MFPFREGKAGKVPQSPSILPVRSPRTGREVTAGMRARHPSIASSRHAAASVFGSQLSSLKSTASACFGFAPSPENRHHHHRNQTDWPVKRRLLQSGPIGVHEVFIVTVTEFAPFNVFAVFLPLADSGGLRTDSRNRRSLHANAKLTCTDPVHRIV